MLTNAEGLFADDDLDRSLAGTCWECGGAFGLVRSSIDGRCAHFRHKVNGGGCGGADETPWHRAMKVAAAGGPALAKGPPPVVEVPLLDNRYRADTYNISFNEVVESYHSPSDTYLPKHRALVEAGYKVIWIVDGDEPKNVKYVDSTPVPKHGVRDLESAGATVIIHSAYRNEFRLRDPQTGWYLHLAIPFIAANLRDPRNPVPPVSIMALATARLELAAQAARRAQLEKEALLKKQQFLRDWDEALGIVKRLAMAPWWKQENIVLNEMCAPRLAARMKADRISYLKRVEEDNARRAGEWAKEQQFLRDWDEALQQERQDRNARWAKEQQVLAERRAREAENTPLAREFRKARAKRAGDPNWMRVK